MVHLESGAEYKITNAKARESVVDLSGGDNQSVIGYGWHGGDNQKWRLEKVRDGPGWIIQNVGTGKFLSITENLADGISVLGTHDPTQWEIKPDEEDSSVVRFYLLNTPFNLDLADHGNPTPGTPVTVWGKWSGRNQCWHLDRV